MSDQRRMIGLWASTSGPALWIRPSRGYSVSVSIAPEQDKPPAVLGLGQRDNQSVVGRWDDYWCELRIPLPRFPYGAALILDYEYVLLEEKNKVEVQLSGGVSMEDVPGVLDADIPKWLMPQQPYRRVSRAEWSKYTMVSCTEVGICCKTAATRQRRTAERRAAPNGRRDGKQRGRAARR
jgi:hypothetical protein